jgi:DNA-binding transcriptional regulator YiaG
MNRRTAATGSTSLLAASGRRAAGRAPISGHVLKVIRESLIVTQEALAEQLGVEIHTLQGWESGRRPLTATSVSNLMRLRQRLRRLGTRPELLDGLTDAVDADCFLDFVFSNEPHRARPDDHPLATWVMKRSFYQMVAWPLNGSRPASIRQVRTRRRRGPVPEMPELSNAEKMHLFESLRAVVDRSHSSRGSAFDSEQARLLRRQAYFIASLDRSPTMEDWLSRMASREGRNLPNLDSWSPGWVTARSLTMAQARLGDPEPLRWFLRNALDSDEGRMADLNYWAYWLGQVPESYHADAFMVDRSTRWHGLSLLRALADILHPNQATMDIYVHSIWTLLRDQPQLLHGDLELLARLRNRLAEVLGQSSTSAESRRKLESLYHGLQLMQPNPTTRLGGGDES